MRRTPVLLVFSFASSLALGQHIPEADTIRTYELSEIVVTATRSQRVPSEVGRSVTVITPNEIRSSIAYSLGELLAERGGIYVVGAGQNPGMIQSLFLRGSANNHTAIMVDDIRISDPSSVNNAVDLSELSLAGVERIEIVRGSHSTLYGSSAIGGVLNLITRRNRMPGLGAEAELRAGTFGPSTSLFGQNIFVDYTSPYGMFATAAFNNLIVNGMDATVDTTRGAFARQRDGDGFSKRDVVATVGFRNDVIDLHASLRTTRHRSDIDKAAYVDDDNARLDFRRSLLTYGLEYAFSPRWSLKFNGGWSEMHRSAIDDSSVVDHTGRTDGMFSENRWRGTTWTNEIQTTLKTFGLEAVIGGGEYRETMSASSYFFANTDFGAFEFSTDLDTLGLHATTRSLFAHVEASGILLDPSLRRFTLTLGGRINRHSSFGTNTTFDVNPSYRIGDQGLLYASFTTGFNAPSLYQLFVPDANYSTGITRGNPNLKPETSKSYELGVKQAVGETATFSASYFHLEVENAIEYVFLWDRDVPPGELGKDWMRDDFRGDTYLNVGRQTSRGVEFSLTSKLTDRLTLSGNVSLVSGRLRFSPDAVDVRHTRGHRVQLFNSGAFLERESEIPILVRRPSTLNLALTYTPSTAWLIRLNVRHAGSRNDVYYDSQLGPYGALGTVPVAEYTIVDLLQRYQLSSSLAIGARVENLFDTKYSEINGFTTRGRGVLLNLRYALGRKTE